MTFRRYFRKLLVRTKTCLISKALYLKDPKNKTFQSIKSLFQYNSTFPHKTITFNAVLNYAGMGEELRSLSLSLQSCQQSLDLQKERSENDNISDLAVHSGLFCLAFQNK